MYLTPDIDALVRRPFPETLAGERYAAVAQYLDAWCELNEITVTEDPDNKPPEVMLARVHEVGDDFWSMRITDPEDTAGMRILGAFSELDTFVGLTLDFREDMKPFTDDVSEAKQIWTDLFGSLKPHTGNTLDDYLTHYYQR